MPSPAFCQHCGQSLAPTARFCPGCGDALLLEPGSPVSVIETPAVPTSPLARGLVALQAGDLDRAIPLLAAAAATGSGAALLAHGTALLRRRRFADALAPLEQAVAALPDRGEPLAYLAMARLHTLDLTGARETMEDALTLAPNSFAVRLKHAEMLFRLGYYREALAEARITLGLTAPDAESLAFAERLADLARRKAPQAYTRQPGRLPRLGIPRLFGRLSARRPRGIRVPQPTVQ
jgi:tetratricopeptide (TPR) repeat protein